MTKPSRDYRLIADSGLFDANHYLLAAPDVAEVGCDPLTHFCEYGAREGRRPNLYFDPVWYAGLYLSGQPADVNPLCHYIRIGERSGLRPVCYFEPLWYARRYRLRPGASALRHYLHHRRSQAYSPNSLFDIETYLTRYGQEIGGNRDAFAHFLRHGAERDLICSPTFDAQAYRAAQILTHAPASAHLSDHEASIPLIHCLDRRAVTEWDRPAHAPLRSLWRRLMRIP